MGDWGGKVIAGKGVSRLLLLLAGVLMVVATVATAGDAAEDGATMVDGSLRGTRRVCELKCQHHQNPDNKKRCIDFCIRYQLALLFDVKEKDGETTTITAGEDGICASRRICKLKCQHHDDPMNKNRCTNVCIGYQVALDAIMEDEATVTITSGGEDSLRGSRYICELKCQHHHDPANKKRCVDFCIRYQLAMHDINDGAAAAGAIRQVV
jgi:hypothetical protein